MHGAHEAEADEAGAQQAQRAGHRHDDDAHADDLILSLAARHRRPLGQAKHLAAGGVDAPVELVAQLVHDGLLAAERRHVVAVQRGQRRRHLPLVARSQRRHQLQARVQPRQRDHVGERAGVAQAGADLLARRRQGVVRRLALLGEDPPIAGHGLQVGRCLQPRDEKPAQVEALLDGADVGAGEGVVAGDVVVDDAVELLADVAREVEGEQRDQRHEAEQAGGDREDLDGDGHAPGGHGPAHIAFRPRACQGF